MAYLAERLSSPCRCSRFTTTNHRKFTRTLTELVDLVEMAKNGVVTPAVTGSYRLEEADEILTELERGEIKGRVVLVS